MPKLVCRSGRGWSKITFNGAIHFNTLYTDPIFEQCFFRQDHLGVFEEIIHGVEFVETKSVHVCNPTKQLWHAREIHFMWKEGKMWIPQDFRTISFPINNHASLSELHIKLMRNSCEDNLPASTVNQFSLIGILIFFYDLATYRVRIKVR